MSKPWWYSEKQALRWYEMVEKDSSFSQFVLRSTAVFGVTMFVVNGLIPLLFGINDTSIATKLGSAAIGGFIGGAIFGLTMAYLGRKNYQYYLCEKTTNEASVS